MVGDRGYRTATGAQPLSEREGPIIPLLARGCPDTAVFAQNVTSASTRTPPAGTAQLLLGWPADLTKGGRSDAPPFDHAAAAMAKVSHCSHSRSQPVRRARPMSRYSCWR